MAHHFTLGLLRLTAGSTAIAVVSVCHESRSTPFSRALCNYCLVLYWPYFARHYFYSALRRAP